MKYILCGQFIPFQYKRYKEGNLGLCQSTKNLRIFLAALREATKSIPTQPCFLDHDPNHRSLEIYEWHHDNWRNTIQYTYIYIIYTRLLNLFEANTTELMIYIHFLDACKARDPRRTVAWSFTRLVIQVHVGKLWFFQSPTIVQYYKCLSLVASAEISSIQDIIGSHELWVLRYVQGEFPMKIKGENLKFPSTGPRAVSKCTAQWPSVVHHNPWRTLQITSPMIMHRMNLRMFRRHFGIISIDTSFRDSKTILATCENTVPAETQALSTAAIVWL